LVPDYSLEDLEDIEKIFTNATFNDMIEVHNNKSTILNCLDIKGLGRPPDTVLGLASDYWALLFTATHLAFQGRQPVGDMIWYLVATLHACSLGHIDTQGLMTYLKVLAGAKFWIIALPQDGSSFDSADTFGKDYNVDLSNSEKQSWRYYGTILEKDDEL
jgi:hypothetical protein